MNESYGHSFLETLWQAIGKSQKSSYREFAAQVFAAVVPTAALYSQYVVQVVDFYLDDDQRAAREEILRLATSTDENSSERIMTYVYEALRQRPPVRYLVSFKGKCSVFAGCWCIQNSNKT